MNRFRMNRSCRTTCRIVLFLLGGLLTPPSPTLAQRPSVDAEKDHINQLVDPDPFRIGPEDVLFISVWKNESLTRVVTVRPDGKISLPLLNDVEAAGLTASELRDLVTKRLTEYMPTPNVTVIITEVRSFKVSILGEVGRPGRYELKSRTTVLDALSLAGGLTSFASRSRIVILRPDGNAMQRIPFNYSKLIHSDSLLDKIINSRGGYQENFYLHSGDIIFVP